MILLFVILAIISADLSEAKNETLDVAEYLKSKCDINPQVNFPGQSTGETTKVSISITPMRFLGISDLSETFTIVAHVDMWWFDQCTKKALKSDDFEHRNYSQFYLKKDSVWTPKILHWNSNNFKSVESNDYERGLRINKHGYFYYIYGVFESYCDLDLEKFPFDRLVIELIFFLFYLFVVLFSTVRNVESIS